MEILGIVLFVVGFILGIVLSWFIFNKLKSRELPEVSIEQLKTENISLKKDIEHLIAKLEETKLEIGTKENKELSLNQENTVLKIQLSEAKSNYINLEEKLANQTKDLAEIQEKFSQEFKLLANSILKQNTEDFAKTHQKELNEILNPLKEKISSFETSVQQKYVDETKERASLKQEIKNLLELNQTLNLQAQNLTNALKGDNKKQGNWGEMVLERILESSGLIKGEEYETQYSDVNNTQQRIRPDVLIKLPDDKHIIVDSKVSLIAYERYVSSEDTTEKELELKNHVLSVKAHVKSLSEKNYQTGLGINSPDFVLLFIPIESSFSLAIQGDADLYNYAWDKKVVIVSPTTLLATLRTIASVWKHERQTKNALEIADKAGRLYDKFKSFVDDMQKIDRGISATRSAYDDAFNKLKSGTGNLIRRTEQIKELGAKTNKSLAKDLIIESHEE
ncbi:MAG: DNA recombination protein RmuC [Bacteroidetes bacterium]|nr:DNA recombination protein RmuC [Bacteroidota bacterium]MCB0803940.1 DNA recombination protein RmuC [Flavobacteriales bacterium]NOG57418.1 DNA recombination protein RmuC [Bacteroidota bacterium]